MTTGELDVRTADGRTLHVYDRAGAADGLAVIWHHGTPNVGAPPEPLFTASDRLGIRWIGYDRPGYGGSDPNPGRDVASAATDVGTVADVLGIDRFAVMGHSGGGPHALAAAALLPGRVVGAVVGASLAPYGADGLEWFEGMAPSGAAALRAAARGRDAKEAYEARAAESEPGFAEADWAVLEGEWAWFGRVVGPALRDGPAPLVDDDLAYVAPWGFDPGSIEVPTLVLAGTEDRVVPPAHAHWLAERIPGAELWLREGEGHVSVLRHGAAALAWLSRVAEAARRSG
jgi:pimeloyl-ACP methyl ester carboxylesterase